MFIVKCAFLTFTGLKMNLKISDRTIVSFAEYVKCVTTGKSLQELVTRNFI